MSTEAMRKAAQDVVDAFDNYGWGPECGDAIRFGLRAALAAPEPKAEAGGIPKGWVPLRIEYEPGYPEDVAFGPQRMMDRLKKWLDNYFSNIAAAPPHPQPEQVTITADELAKYQHAHRWATELAVNLARKHYPEVTQWKPLPDLLGVITQLDNMSTGLVRAPQPEQAAQAPHEHAVAALRMALRDMEAIKCPVSDSGALVGYFCNRLNEQAAQAAQARAGQTELDELRDAARVNLENYEFMRAKADRATAAVYQFHYAMKDAGWHPGRTDDNLPDIIRAKGEELRTALAALAAPSQPEAGRVGLTEAQIAAVAFEAIGYDGTGFQDVHSGDLRWFARCIERAHSIPAAKE